MGEIGRSGGFGIFPLIKNTHPLNLIWQFLFQMGKENPQRRDSCSKCLSSGILKQPDNVTVIEEDKPIRMRMTDSKKTGTSSKGVVIDCDEIRIIPASNEEQKLITLNGNSTTRKKRSNQKGKFMKRISNASSGKLIGSRIFRPNKFAQYQFAEWD